MTSQVPLGSILATLRWLLVGDKLLDEIEGQGCKIGGKIGYADDLIIIVRRQCLVTLTTAAVVFIRKYHGIILDSELSKKLHLEKRC